MQDRKRTPDKTVAQEAERVRIERQRTMQHMAARASLAQEPRPAASLSPRQQPSPSWQEQGGKLSDTVADQLKAPSAPPASQPRAGGQEVVSLGKELQSHGVRQGSEKQSPEETANIEAALDKPQQTGSNSHRQMSATQAARAQAKQAAQQGKESPSPSMQR